MATLSVLLGSVFLAAPAQAYDFRPDILPLSAPPTDCASGRPADPSLCTRTYTGNVCPIDYTSDVLDPLINKRSFGLTKRLVLCIKETIIYGTYKVLVPISDFFSKIIAIVLTLTVALWGVRTATGNRDNVLHKSLLVLAVKIGVVVVFTANFAQDVFDPHGTRGGLFGMMMDGIEEILGFVTSYISFSTLIKCPAYASTSTGSAIVWDRVDCALETLIGGIFPINGRPPGYSLVLGITGFLVLCLFSGPIGVFIALAGFYLIYKLLMALVRALYIYIMAYTAFALMVLISPIFITLILFRTTIGYFEKWYRLCISFILQPIFLFAYLAMLVAAFDSVVFTGPNSLYRVIAGTQMDGKKLGYPDLFTRPPDNPADFFVMGEKLNNASVGGKPVYAEDNQGNMAIKIDPEQVRRTFGLPVARDAGPVDVVGEIASNAPNWDNPNGIFGYLNPGVKKNFFKIDIPNKRIDWNVLAQWSSGAANCDAICTSNYVSRLILAIIMAVIVAYIFFAMLDYLPFIGTGLASDSASFPVLGIKNNDHNMGVPGDGMLGSLQKKLSAKMGLGE